MSILNPILKIITSVKKVIKRLLRNNTAGIITQILTKII